MNAHTYPTPAAAPAHATYAPSSAHRWTVCTASAEGIAALGEQETNEAAEQGTAAHEEIERILGELNGKAPGHRFAMPASDPDHPGAYGVAMVLDYVRQLPPGRFWIEQRVQLTPQIWGRCDVAHWHEPTRTLTIVDYKNGFVGVDADENEQLSIYALASIYTHSLPALWVRLVVVQPNDFRPLPRVKQWVTSAEDLRNRAQPWAAIPEGPKAFVAGEHCRYCPLFGRCDATRDLLAHLSTAMQHTPDEVRPDQVAIFKALEKPLADWFKGLDKSATKRALSGAVPPDMKLVEAQKHKAWADPNAARAFVVATLGADALDVPTPAQAIERGCPEAEVNKMAPRPPGAPVLAFASDKRKPWVPKSVDEIFKGAPGVNS